MTAPAADLVLDEQTRSTWDLTTGHCLTGILAKAMLAEAPVTSVYWWAGDDFYPNTEVVDKGTPSIF